MYKFRIDTDITSDEHWGFSPQVLNLHLQEAKGDDLFIDINSYGGCVIGGMAIFAELRRYAKENDASITTRSSGFVASIATAIFLAGDKRIVNEYLQPFVHEPRIVGSRAETSSDYTKNASDLEVTRTKLAQFYSNNTNLSFEEAEELMKNDSWITAEKCLEIGFATEIEKLNNVDAKLVASLSTKFNYKNNNKKENEMSEQKTKLGWLARVINATQKPSAVAKLELSDMSGNPVVFPDLEEGDTPKVGDKVTVNEDALFTGHVETENYIMEVEEGLVTEIISADEIDKDELIDDLVERIEELKEEVEASAKEKTRLSGVISAMKSNENPSTEKTQKGGNEVVNEKETKFANSIEKAKERIKNKKK